LVAAFGKTIMISTMKKYAVIGHPIAHSKSPQLHSAGFYEMEIDAEFSAVEVLPENLGSWIEKEFRPYYKGCAVTIPHKTEILKYVDTVSDAAIQIGAVNTLYWDQGVLIGTNTDGIGALRALSSVVSTLKDKKVLILGAGGASRAIIFALILAKAKVAIWNRTNDNALHLSTEFECGVVEELNEANFSLFDIVINTTSVGMKEWKSVVPTDFWDASQVAFDIVYDPLETKFLSDASDAGCEIVTGDQMLVHQALEQFKIWHQIELEPEIMGNAFFDS